MPVAKRRADTDTTAAPPPPQMEWTGWYRPRGGQWQALVSAATYDLAMQALLMSANRAGRNADLVVLRAGVGP